MWCWLTVTCADRPLINISAWLGSWVQHGSQWPCIPARGIARDKIPSSGGSDRWGYSQPERASGLASCEERPERAPSLFRLCDRRFVTAPRCDRWCNSRCACRWALVMSKFGQTKREQLTHAIGNLRDVGAMVFGAVFTMTPTPGSSRNDYNYNYNYNYDGDDRRGPVTRLSAPAAEATPNRASVNGTKATKSEGIDTVDLTNRTRGKRGDSGRPGRQVRVG